MKRIHSVVWKEDKWYVAKALEVEIASQGKNEKEALANLKEAVELYLELLTYSKANRYDQKRI